MSTEVKFKGDPVKLGGSVLKEGDLAPNFVLVNQALENKKLEDYQGRSKLFYVVPSLDTSVCLQSSKKLSEMAKKYPEVEFLIVSADLPFAQARICGLEKLDNLTTLSMMRSKQFAKSFGILIEEGPLAGLTARCVLILDDRDRVTYIELVPEITQEPNYESLENALKG